MKRATILVFSNSAFVVPLVLALYWSVYWYALVLLVSMVVSIVYHYSSETLYKKVDVVCAVVLIMSNFVLLFLGALLPVSLAVLACLTAALALYVYYCQAQHYSVFHSWYHVLSAVVCIVCVLVYQF